MKRKLIEEIGLLDETNFPIHYDEADFCKRARLAGWTVLTVTRARIWHDIPSPSQSKNFDRTFFSQKEERVYFAARNRIIFHRKHTKPREYIIFSALFLPLFATYYLLRIIRSKSGRRTRLMSAYMRGVLDGLAMKQAK